MKALRTVVAVLALLAFAATAAAQGQDRFLVPIPEKLERATVVDDAGLQKWADYEPERCVNCKGRSTMTCQHCLRFDEGDHSDCLECGETKKAPCRICAATGKMPDILERAPCPTCFGASVTRCFICNGAGKFPVAGGGSRLQKCGCCGGAGAYPCATCKGQRYVDPPKLRPSAGEAKLADLEKALNSVEAVAEALGELSASGDGRKDIKAWNKMLKPGTKYFPALKTARKHFEQSTKSQAKGAVWKHYREAATASTNSAKQALDYFVKHQKRLLELCKARAEHNAGVAEKKK